MVQLVRSFTFLKCGCFSLRPVSKTATFTPAPTPSHERRVSFRHSCIGSEQGVQSAAPTRVAHLPKNICLEDLGDVAGDRPEEPPAGVAPGGVPEARAQRQTGSPERTGRLPRLPLLRLGAGVARSSGLGCFRDRSRAVTGRTLPALTTTSGEGRLRPRSNHRATLGAHLHTCAAARTQMWPPNYKRPVTMIKVLHLLQLEKSLHAKGGYTHTTG